MSTAVVTGASSGLGKEIARQLHAQGYDVTIVARSEAALQELASELTHVRILVADLATPDGIALVSAEVGNTDLLVNNAGFGSLGNVADLASGEMERMIAVNCVAVTTLTRAALPGMLARGRGAILNVASTAAFQPGPGMATYYASKAYVLSFTEAVAEEVRGTGVSVTAFCPGAFSSGFFATAHAESSRLAKYVPLPTSSKMATAALAAAKARKVVAIPGVMNKSGTWLVRFMPRMIVRRVVKFVQAQG